MGATKVNESDFRLQAGEPRSVRTRVLRDLGSNLSPALRAPRSALPRFLLFALLVIVTPGCIALPAYLGRNKEAPAAGVNLVVSRWENQVLLGQDPIHGGSMPCLSGRVYLFTDDSGYPVAGNGAIKVELYDAATPGAKPLEDWVFDPHTLRRLLHKDIIGQGYSLFLPWTTYRPNITHVTLTVSYLGPQGMPIYAPPTPITLSPDNRPLTPIARPIPAGPTLPARTGPALQAPASLPGTIPPSAAPLPPATQSGPTRIPLPTSRHSAFSHLVP